MKHHNGGQRKCGPHAGEPRGYALGHRSSAERMPVSQEVRGDPWEPFRGVAADQDPSLLTSRAAWREQVTAV